jgi:hypothetical protein
MPDKPRLTALVAVLAAAGGAGGGGGLGLAECLLDKRLVHEEFFQLVLKGL